MRSRFSNTLPTRGTCWLSTSVTASPGASPKLTFSVRQTSSGWRRAASRLAKLARAPLECSRPLMIENLVCFAHGKESGPWGTKITHLAQIAHGRGFDVLSPDYRHSHDPHERVAHLLKLAPQARRLVLVGSSMGAYVAAMACAHLQPRALFLMAPALYFPGWDEEPAGVPALTTVVHGWNDDIVPVERAQRFAQRNHAALHIVESGHTLNDQLPMLGTLFDALLNHVVSN